MILRAKNITKSYADVSVLKGIDLALNAGESVAIVGKSGEGKSTLLQILGTLDRASHGTLEIAGQDVRSQHLPTLRNQQLGFVFQNAHLIEEESVLENVLLPSRIAKKVSRKRALDLIDAVGLSHRADFSAKLLSGGERQRVAIARALMCNPSLILADEPSGNLDTEHSAQVQELLFSTVKKEGKALLLVTHDLEFAKLCDRLFVLKNGILQQV